MRWRLPVVAALLAALPLAHATTPAVVLVQPSADSVPANLLRLSIVFAAPVEGAVLPRIAEMFPRFKSGTPTTDWLEQTRPTPVVTPLRDEVTRGIARTLWMLAAAAGLVLLVTCANVANLMLIRADGRQLDLAVREHEHLTVIDAAQCYPEKIADAKLQRHAHAANGTMQHHALAIELDLAHEAVGTGVMRLEADGQREGVEPQRTARPSGIDPACCCLTPHVFVSPPGFCSRSLRETLSQPRRFLLKKPG